MDNSVAIFFILQRKKNLKARAKKTTGQRITAVFILFALFAGYLIYNIWNLSVLRFDYYKNKTYDQITTTSTLTANRGKIYDRNMNILAESETKWRIFTSPRDIKTASKNDGKDYIAIISSGLSSILSVDSERIRKKLSDASVLDVTIKRSANEEEYKKALKFTKDNFLDKLIQFEATTSRYYPEGTLAAHTLGFVGSDNQGLYGLEYFYDKTLAGTDGYYVYAKDANGNILDTEYSDYVPAEDGYSLVTTIDSYLQGEMEAIIENIRVTHNVSNRVCGVAMDTKTGAILAMATSSPFDPNEPFVLDELSAEKLNSSGLINGTEEYKAYKNELLSIMWSNKAISETYEPGSTFKIVTVSAALDTGSSHLTDRFSCSGATSVGGYNIHCHKRGGHGSGFTLAYGLQMSCNPCMIAISERLGVDSFYSYVEKFGYLEKTGIDLPSEASAIFHKKENIGTTELATASFGQRFKVTIINQLTAIAAVANGGKLVTPYIVDKIISSDGNVISEHEPEIRRQVISGDIAKTVSDILIEGVNGDGGAKNAGVIGYDIAAKTGTSQKFDILDENGNSYLRIGSTVAFSTDADRGIAVIIVVDEPNSEVKYGSTVAAPYVSVFLEKALPYLEHTSKNDVNVTVDNYVGMSVSSAKAELTKKQIAYEIVGSGDVVLSQTPNGGEIFSSPVSKIILYTDAAQDEYITVPKLVGLSTAEAAKIAVNSGLNIKFTSSLGAPSAAVISEQSIPPGTRIRRGTVITLRILSQDFED